MDFGGREKRAADESEAAGDKRQRVEQDETLESDVLAVWEEEQKERREKRKQYYMTYGVGYSFRPASVSFKTDPLVNDDARLLGKYNLVFYKSRSATNPESDNYEKISRKARGNMELSLKTWNDKPALFGTFALDTRKSNGERDGGEASWGNYTEASFIENVTNLNPPRNAMTRLNFPPNPNGSEGQRDFLLDRYPYCGVEWWSDLGHEQQDEPDSDSSDSDFEYGDGLCTATLKVVAEKCALPLWPYDALRGNDSLHTLLSEDGEIYLQQDRMWTVDFAQGLMEAYRNGRTSWMHRQLNIPADVAFKIRQFVTPPPAFFVQEGDLVLSVEESKEAGWFKTLVFRQRH